MIARLLLEFSSGKNVRHHHTPHTNSYIFLFLLEVSPSPSSKSEVEVAHIRSTHGHRTNVQT